MHYSYFFPVYPHYHYMTALARTSSLSLLITFYPKLPHHSLSPHKQIAYICHDYRLTAPYNTYFFSALLLYPKPHHSLSRTHKSMCNYSQPLFSYFIVYNNPQFFSSPVTTVDPQHHNNFYLVASFYLFV